MAVKKPPCSECSRTDGNHTETCKNNPKNWPKGPTPK